MRILLTPVVLLCALLFTAAIPAPAGAESCVTGTVTAEFNTDPAFPKLWKYCAEVSWDVGQFALSHLDMFLELPDCDCICNPLFLKFAQPAGHSTNTSGEPCELDYLGEFVCKGDPSLPPEYGSPAVKFEPDPYATCEPGTSGYGTFCFYSPMPPLPATEFPQGLAIKHGQEVCYGTLLGQMPSCDCALPAGAPTWGSLKQLYR